MGLETKLVIEDEISVSDGKDFEYLAVDSLRICLALAVYDSNHVISGVTHVRFTNDIDIKGRLVSNESCGYRRNFWKAYGFANRLIQQADQLGGDRYLLSVFNLNSKDRTSNENLQLKSVVDAIITYLSTAGKIVNVEYRQEQAFRLSTRNGNILLYHKD